MSFDAVADAALTVLKLHESYDARNVSKYSYEVLGGGIDRAIVIQYGGLDRPRTVIAASGRRVNTPWIANLELYLPYRDRNQIGKDVVDEVQNILDHVDKYPTLNGASNVVNAAA